MRSAPQTTRLTQDLTLKYGCVINFVFYQTFVHQTKVKWTDIITLSLAYMLEFIQLLKQRYQTISSHTNETGKPYHQQRIDQLILAEAFLRKGQILDSVPGFPLHISIIGPTQAGKSTLVNVLLNNPIAGVSPLAGYTVHPQGFCNGLSLHDCNGLQRYFGRFQCIHQTQLSKERYDCYSLTENTINSDILPQCVVWDTPDFDSIDSATYREGVIRASTLADIVILVVSKDKYADQSVWEMMSSLEALHQPTVICLNKLAPGSEDILIHSLKKKWHNARTDHFPVVVPLYYSSQTGIPVWPSSQLNLLKQLAAKVSHKTQMRFEKELLKKHWQSWLEPVIIEHQALTDWQNLVHAILKQALESYQRDYQSQPHYYETFQLALGELLILLEVPRFADFISGARKALTWPVRQLTKFGRKRLNITENSHETLMLKQIAEHILIQIADKLLDNAEQSQQNQWWKELGSLLRKQRPGILDDFSQATKAYQSCFHQDVEQAAQRLYNKLQQQPVVLNSLRATRVTADAVVIVLTLNTGGIGLHDLLVAPAMLMLTSLLTESAVGSYMHKVETELKQQQLKVVEQKLFIGCMAKNLLALPEHLSNINHFNVSRAELEAIETQLNEKPHGLRLL